MERTTTTVGVLFPVGDRTKTVKKSKADGDVFAELRDVVLDHAAVVTARDQSVLGGDVHSGHVVGMVLEGVKRLGRVKVPENGGVIFGGRREES